MLPGIPNCLAAVVDRKANRLLVGLPDRDAVLLHKNEQSVLVSLEVVSLR